MPAMTRRRLKFKAETGITTYKWDVCGLRRLRGRRSRRIEADLGPVDDPREQCRHHDGRDVPSR